MPNYVAAKISQSPEESCSIGEGLDRTYTKRFDVTLDLEQSDSQDISPSQVYKYIPGLPQYGDIWIARDNVDRDELCICRSYQGKRDHNNKAQFSFTFNYSAVGNTSTPQEPDRNQGGGTDVVDHLTPQWTITTEDRMETMPDGKDLDGKKFLNSAGDPFEPEPEYNAPLIVLNYSRIETSFTEITDEALVGNVFAFKYKTNNASFIFADDTDKWLITDYVLKVEYIGVNRLIRRDMTLKYNDRGWRDKILDAGLYELIDTTLTDYEEGVGNVPAWTEENKQPILASKSNQPVTRPWPLDGQGQAIRDFNATPRVYKSFRLKESVDYSLLEIVLR